MRIFFHYIEGSHVNSVFDIVPWIIIDIWTFIRADDIFEAQSYMIFDGADRAL